MSRSGSSLLEVLMGLSIVSVAVIAVAGAMRQGARDVVSSADHTAALSLQQRIAEELLQASQNLDSDALLVALAADGALSIQGGKHPMFAPLEDSSATFGRLEPGKDAALSATLGVTFHHYGAFTARVSSDPVGTNSGEVAADIRLESPSRAGGKREFALPLVLGFSVEAPTEAAPLAPPGSMDTAVAALLYPGAGDLLDRAVGRGCALGVVRDLGELLVLLRAQATRDDELAAASATLRAASSSSGDCGEAQALGRIAERRAAVAWSALVEVAPRIERLAGTIVRTQLGGVAVGTGALVRGELQRAALLGARLNEHIAEALSAYRQAREAAAASTPTLVCVELDRKILDLACVLAQADPVRGQPFLAAWLAFVTDTYRGRHRQMEALLARERALASDTARLSVAHPAVAARLASLRAALPLIPALTARCARELP